MLAPNVPHHGSKQADGSDQPIVRIPFEQIDGEEIGAAGYAITSIVGHWVPASRDELMRRNTRVRYCALRGLTPFFLLEGKQERYIVLIGHREI
jgi:hypothetical protein